MSHQRENFDHIPQIDFSTFLSGSDKLSVAKKIDWAARNVGFFYITGHNIPVKLIQETFKQAQWFFDLAQAEKDSIALEHSDTALRGYIAPGVENLGISKIDLKEALDIGPAYVGNNPPLFYGDNLWTKAMEGQFKHVVETYHKSVSELSKQIFKAFALGLDMPENTFDSYVDNPIDILRLLHYPTKENVNPDANSTGCGAHTDYNALTMIIQDDVGGLQVMNRDKEWIDAPYVENSFVVNIGDILQIFTNDLYISNMHRVSNPSGRQRYSIPFFLTPNGDSIIKPMDPFISDENPAQYKTQTCEEFKFKRYAPRFPHLASSLAA